MSGKVVIYRTGDGIAGLALESDLPREAVELLVWNQETGLYDVMPITL